MDPMSLARPHSATLDAPRPAIRNSPLIPAGSLITHSCSFCQHRKLKCDMQSPCGQCSKRSLQCFYVERLPGKKRGPKPKKDIDMGIVARIVPGADNQQQALQNLTAEVAKLKAEVANLRATGPAAIASPTQKFFTAETESFVQQHSACQIILQEFANTIMPVLSWYSLPDPQRLLYCWSSLLRDSVPNLSESLRHFYDPETVSVQLEACSIFSLTSGLMRKSDLAEHFEDLCQTYIQNIFFKREAKLDQSCLRRVGSAVMLLMFRYMTDSKPMATRYLGTILVELASQLDASGAPEDAELLYAIATRAAGMCVDTRTAPPWLRRISSETSGRSFISTIELKFFEIFNQLMSGGAEPFASSDQLALFQILSKLDAVEQMTQNAESLPEHRAASFDALQYYRCWFIMLRGEVYLRLGREDLVPDLMRLAGSIVARLPFGLRVALAGLTNFSGQGPNGVGLRVASTLLAHLQPLAMQTPTYTAHSLTDSPEWIQYSQPVSPPSEEGFSSETLHQSPTNLLPMVSTPEIVEFEEPQPVDPTLEELLFSGM